MSQIISLAEQLGKDIAQSPQAVGLRAARAELNKQADLLQLLKDYQAQTEKIARAEHEGKPVEVGDKHKLADIHGRLVASEVFKRFTAAQVEYVDLMRRVNDELRHHLRDVEQGGTQTPA